MGGRWGGVVGVRQHDRQQDDRRNRGRYDAPLAARRFPSFDPWARRNTHIAKANAPITTASRLIHVSAVVVGMLPTASVNPNAFLRSTAGLASDDVAGTSGTVAPHRHQLLERHET